MTNIFVMSLLYCHFFPDILSCQQALLAVRLLDDSNMIYQHNLSTLACKYSRLSLSHVEAGANKRWLRRHKIRHIMTVHLACWGNEEISNL